MPPKRTSKTETINASKRSKNGDNTDPPPCAINDMTEHDSKTSGDATEVTKLTSPFDACLFLQKQTMAAASRNNATPLFFLNTASVATAAKHAQPLTNMASIPAKNTMPDVVAVPAKITMPDVAASASLSTLSKQFDTLHHGIQLTQSMVVHHTATPTAAVPSLPQYNLSMTAFTDSTLRSIVKTCIKDHIFRKCKFFNRFKHNAFDTNPKSMCGQIMKHCSLTADATWWYGIRTLVIKTLTDHRNNCIKRLNARFKGTYLIVCVACRSTGLLTPVVCICQVNPEVAAITQCIT